jgi:membrane-associated phospholipid phosphatase
MPSGDAFQSAAFITFMSTLGLNPFGLLLFHIGVCLGRVYFMCHWVADTVVSSVLGVLVAKLLLTL